MRPRQEKNNKKISKIFLLYPASILLSIFRPNPLFRTKPQNDKKGRSEFSPNLPYLNLHNLSYKKTPARTTITETVIRDRTVVTAKSSDA